MPQQIARYANSGCYSIVSVFKLPSGTTEVKTYGPYSYIEKALSEKRKLLSGNSMLAGQVLRKQAQVYVLPMLIWTAKTEVL